MLDQIEYGNPSNAAFDLLIQLLHSHFVKESIIKLGLGEPSYVLWSNDVVLFIVKMK